MLCSLQQGRSCLPAQQTPKAKEEELSGVTEGVTAHRVQRGQVTSYSLHCKSEGLLDEEEEMGLSRPRLEQRAESQMLGISGSSKRSLASPQKSQM